MSTDVLPDTSSLVVAERKPVSKSFYIDFGRGPVECIQDSGAEISVVKPHITGPKLMHQQYVSTEVTLSSSFGNQDRLRNSS
jgi:hypothetical protein